MKFPLVLKRIFGIMFLQKVSAWGLLALVIFLLRDFLGLFLIVFIFSYIFLRLARLISGRISLRRNASQKVPHSPSEKQTNMVVTILYLLFIVIVILVLVNIIPIMIREIHELIRQAPLLVKNFEEMIGKFEGSLGTNWVSGGGEGYGRFSLGLNEYINEKMNVRNIEEIGRMLIRNLQSIGGVMVKVIIGLILSYIFIMERNSIRTFVNKIRMSSFGFFYEEYASLGGKIANGFGRIMEAQMIIALVNATLTALGLLVISFVHGGQSFPYIFTLSFVVFIFGFIPVLGTFISAFPILIIAYGYGAITGDQYIIVASCIIMIAIIHAIEAYYLNPKIVSSYMHFPVFITFVILLVSEHFFGITGLIIGVPIFSIVVSLFQDLDHYLRWATARPEKGEEKYL